MNCVCVYTRTIYGTISIKVTVRVTLPTLATTVTGYFPEGVVVVVVTVSTDVVFVEMVAGLKLALAPGIDERPVAVRLTFPVMPPSATVFNVNVAWWAELILTPLIFPLISQ